MSRHTSLDCCQHGEIGLQGEPALEVKYDLPGGQMCSFVARCGRSMAVVLVVAELADSQLAYTSCTGQPPGYSSSSPEEDSEKL